MKLVRDRIPEHLINQGMNPVYKLVDKKDGLRYDLLRDLMVQTGGEAATAMKSGNPEEVLRALASLMEVVGKCAEQYKLGMKDVQAERNKLRLLNGKYDKFVAMIEENNSRSF